jgi:hypothetical protein
VHNLPNLPTQNLNLRKSCEDNNWKFYPDGLGNDWHQAQPIIEKKNIICPFFYVNISSIFHYVLEGKKNPNVALEKTLSTTLERI